MTRVAKLENMPLVDPIVDDRGRRIGSSATIYRMDELDSRYYRPGYYYSVRQLRQSSRDSEPIGFGSGGPLNGPYATFEECDQRATKAMQRSLAVARRKWSRP